MNALIDITLFLAAMAWLIVLPGMAVLRAIFPWERNPVRHLAYAIVVGIALLDALMIIAQTVLKLPLSPSVVATIPIIPLVVAAIIRRRSAETAATLSAPHRRIAVAAIGLFALVVAIKTPFVARTAFPTATDMGHHLYWVNAIVTTQSIVPYTKRTLINSDDGVTLSDPRPIADFIIGEHLPLAAILLLTGVDITHVTPVLFLFILELLSVVAVALLAADIARHLYTTRYAAEGAFLSALFIGGAIYAISGAQTKFVTGGVIGNIFGIVCIPLIMGAFFRALTEQNDQRGGRWAALGMALSVLLAYTHHLSTFLLIYALAGVSAMIGVLALRHHTLRPLLHTLWRRGTHRGVIGVLVAIILLLILHRVAYLSPDVVASATGAPSKATRTGVSLVQLWASVGALRATLGVFGAVVALIIAVRRPRATIAGALVFGWVAIMMAAALIPQALGINIISTRVANYATIPLTVAAAVALTWIVYRAVHLPRYAIPAVTLLFATLVMDGFADNAAALRRAAGANAPAALQTYAAARYIAQHAPAHAWTLKDHNYLTADTWMKLFFVRDYSYPLSRSYFRRYQNSPNRERCTLLMIDNPDSPFAKDCFRALSVQYVVVHPERDARTFDALPEFRRIFDSATATVFVRINTSL